MKFSTEFVSECRERSTFGEHIPAPLFRKSFSLTADIKRAEILISGLGFYDLFVNGKKITKGFLAPYISNTDHITYFDNYDLKSYLKDGENVVGVMLGDGFQNGKTRTWNFADNVFNSSPKLALTLEIETDKENLSFNATDFKCKKGPILFNDMRAGVHFDNRLAQKGWNDIGYTEDESWHTPIVADRPRGKAKICEAEPIVVTKELKPISVTKGELCDYAAFGRAYETVEGAPARTGGYIFDFGENNAGIFRLKIKGEAGQRIDIQCAEKLTDSKADYSNISFYPDGYSQRCIYTLSGDGEEIFEPMFAYFGYRYLYVSGITEEQATGSLLTYLVMSSDLKERGTFGCSDEVANKIYEAGRRSDISNFYYFPTDCPHREKNGWTGDASASAEHMIMTINPENSWREWMNNIRLAQTEEGQIPGIVPTDKWGYEWCNGPAWDSVLFNLPYMTYHYRGETEMIKENAHAMLAYLEYISKTRDEDGIVEMGLGDWLPVVKDNGLNKEGGVYDTPLGFTGSVMVLDMCRKAEIMFKAIKYDLHAEFAKKLGEQMYEAIRKNYIDFSTMLVRGNSQSSQAIAIYFDVFAPSEKKAAFERLVDIIHRDNDSITVGFLGLRVIFHVLSQFGESDLAYKMITKKEYPSYGYWIAQGETTLLEHFMPDKNFPESKNHHFFGDVLNWFMRYPGGINVLSSKKVNIKPHFITALDHAYATHTLPDGEVAVKWQRDGDDIILTATCPENVKCDIDLPDGYIFKSSTISYAKGGVKEERIIRA